MKKESKEDIKIARNHLSRFIQKIYKIKLEDEELYDEIIKNNKLLLDIIDLMEVLKNEYEK